MGEPMPRLAKAVSDDRIESVAVHRSPKEPGGNAVNAEHSLRSRHPIVLSENPARQAVRL